jgi:curved DNA-binding protein CbpA
MSELPEPLAQGDLAKTPFAHVLLYVEQQKLNGTLVVWKPEAGAERPKQDRIRFEAGLPVAGRLIETASRLERAMLPLFARSDGPYAFYADTDLVGGGEAVREGRVELIPLIAASLRGSSRDDAVASVVRAFGNAKLRLRHGVDLSTFGLLPEEKTTLELLRAEPVSAERLAEMSGLAPRMVLRLVYLLALTKSIEAWEGVDAVPSKRPAPSRSTPPKQTEARKEKKGDGPKGKNKGAPEPAPPPPPGLSSEHKKQWEEIAARAVAIDTENYYDMLQVPRDASAAAIQKAYFALVKKWHPDRVPKELDEIRLHAELIFRHLTRAQETLTDENIRGRYLATVQDGGGTPEADREMNAIVGAAMEFRKVEILMRRREWAGALRIVDECIEAIPDDPDYHATRGWLLFQMGDEARRFDVMTALDRALAISDKHDKAHFYKGLVLKRQGKHEQALVHLRQAAELDPKNIEAVREVRIAEMRDPDKDKKGGSGDSFFGKLFGNKKK